MFSAASHLIYDAPHMLVLGSLLAFVFFGLIFCVGGDKERDVHLVCKLSLFKIF